MPDDPLSLLIVHFKDPTGFLKNSFEIEAEVTETIRTILLNSQIERHFHFQNVFFGYHSSQHGDFKWPNSPNVPRIYAQVRN